MNRLRQINICVKEEAYESFRARRMTHERERHRHIHIHIEEQEHRAWSRGRRTLTYGEAECDEAR